MADVAVVGAGIGGLSSAARLAKLGHRVTVFERRPTAGGRLHSVERDGFRWDAGPAATVLPAVLRDLFRKSGRPIERYLELELRTPTRRHVFADGAVVDLPTGSRADQIRAVDGGLGAGAGASWTTFVDSQAGVWDVFRRSPLGPDGPTDPVDDGLVAQLAMRRSVDQLLHRCLSDQRLRDMVGYRFVMGGSALRAVPAYAAMSAYVERSLGVWTCRGGLSALGDALVGRLAERQVEIRYDTTVVRIVSDARGVTGVEQEDGAFWPASLVVAAVDPLRVFGELVGRRGAKAVRVFSSATRVDPPSTTHLGLRQLDPVGMAADIVLHGDPLITVQTGGTAPAGHRAWTVRRRGGVSGEDVLAAMARRGVDVRGDVVARVDRTPSQIRAETGAAAYTIAWDSPRAQRRRSAFANPLPGLHVLAAPLTPDASIPEVVWTAAHVANRIGKA